MKMNWQWIITTAIAAYAALLSTYNIVSKRRRIVVTMTYGILTYDVPVTSGQMMIITALNRGARTVTLTSTGLLLPDQRQLVLTSSEGAVPLPHQLNEGMACKQWIAVADIEGKLRDQGYFGKIEVRGFYRDALSKRYVSEPIEIDLKGSYSYPQRYK